MDKQSSAGNKRFFGVYLETGQGSEFTNEASENIDMLTLESRKQGLGRAMKEVLGNDAWLLLNDVSGFIGPEVFKTKDQLIRVALEDLVIAKLHGLTGGLDVCSTFHMPITPKELREALDEIVKARPAYLMALPTQNDPMLSYNTTPFQEHLRLRKENNLKIDSKMMNFFISIGVLNADGSPGLHFADPTWVFYKYLEAKDKGAGQLPRDRRFYNGDKLKSFEDVKKIAEAEMKEVTSRGVPLAIGHGATYLDFTPEMQTWLDDVDQRARKSIRKTWNSKWRNKFKSPILKTTSLSRDEYLSRPKSGESLSASAYKKLSKIDIKESDVVLVISDGLNADSLMDRGHLGPFLKNLKAGLEQEGLRVHKEPIVIQNGRVRVGYRVGEQLFGSTNGGPDRPKTVIHIIGERPGNGHNTFSAYISTSNEWAIPNSMNHDKTMLVSGIADTAFKPKQAATEVIQKVQERRQQILSMSKNSCLSFYNR